MDNSIVQLASNFTGTKPMGTLNRWGSYEREKKDIACLKIVSMYNKKDGWCQSRWHVHCSLQDTMQEHALYIKLFWHMVDIAKLNTWILHRREEILHDVSGKSWKCSPVIPNPLIGHWLVPVFDKKNVTFAKLTHKWHTKNVKWQYVCSKIQIVL